LKKMSFVHHRRLAHCGENVLKKIKTSIIDTGFFALCLIILLWVNPQNVYASEDSLATASPAIRIGEELVFKIRYGFIKAGTAHMQVIGLTEKLDKSVLHIQTTAKNLPAFSWIYKVDDEVNAYVDPVKLIPYYFEKKLREGTYKADLRVKYGHEDSLASVEFIRYKKDMTIRKQKNYPVKIPANVYDILSAFYYIRTQPLKVGHSFFLSSHESKKVYDLEVKVHRKETVKVDAGTFRCIVVEPLLKGQGIFKQKGRLLIWLTNDELKIPVQMTSAITIGHITSELVQMKGVDLEIPARIK